MNPPCSRSPRFEVHIVSATDSPEFSLFLRALRHSPLIGLDAEWKPRRRQTPPDPIHVSPFPAVTLLQVACRVAPGSADPVVGETPVFLVDLLSVPAAALWEPLRELFGSPDVLKLGFRFKQDLVYLSSTFSTRGCDPGFDRVEPFLDISNIYDYLKNQTIGKKLPRETKSLTNICQELLCVSLSKELQCSDWSHRPLSEEQILYAAADAYYLLEIFSVFQKKIMSEGDVALGVGTYEGSKMPETRAFGCNSSNNSTVVPTSCNPSEDLLFNNCLTSIGRKYGEKILLNESDKKPRHSRRKGKDQLHLIDNKREKLRNDGDWYGPPPWDPSIGGDGCPKFLCDVMVEGLAKHLRCVGFDAATPSSKKPEPRQLLSQASKEKRVLLTRDVKLLKHQYLIGNQVYKVKSLLKNDQLLEVIETFQLTVSEEQLMSRCTKCNGSFVQKPLTIEEAIEASKGFQVIPPCLFNQNLQFWKCTDCNQLYWEGTQYHNAVQKFLSVCKLNE